MCADVSPTGVTVRLRQAVRAVVADPTDRVLLCRWHFEDPDGPVDIWGLPGGGVDPGESPADALRRELREETGLLLEEPGPVVAHRRHRTPMRSTDGQQWDGQEEWFYVLRVHAFDPHGSMSAEELATENVTGLTWFTLDEVNALSGSPATYTAPRSLADFLRTMLTRGDDAAVVEVEE
jgi:8-oxo-dGTP diphosphatase